MDGLSGHILVVGDVVNMLGVPAETLERACAGARVSRTVLRSEVLRTLRREPLDVMITTSAAAFLGSQDFITVFSARQTPLVLLVAMRHPESAVPAYIVGVQVQYIALPTDAAALRGQVEAALRAARTPIRAARPPEPTSSIETAKPDPPGRGTLVELPTSSPVKRGDEEMSNISKTLEEAMKIDGAIGVALADWESGLCLGTAGGGARLNIEVAAAGNCQVVKAKMATMNELGIKGAIHDILITLDDQVHLIRPLRRGESLFLYLAIDKTKGNLGMARHKVQKLESELNI